MHICTTVIRQVDGAICFVRDPLERDKFAQAVGGTALPKFGQSQYEALNSMKSHDCKDLALVSLKPKEEVYTAACSNGASLIIQCAWGACSALN